MRIDFRMVTVVVAAAMAWTTAAADALKLTAATDHADALYRIGEEAVFTVTASTAAGGKATAGRLAVTLDDWRRQTLVERTVDLAKENPFVVSGKLGEPGFVRLRVKGEGLEKPFLGGVAFEPERIEPGGTCPDDFDAFWREAQARLEAEVPLDPRLEHRPERSTAAYDFWRVSFATAGGRRVWGFMSVPKDKSKAPFPVSFEVASAGEGKWTMDMASGSPDRIRMYFTVHAFEPPATVEELLVIRKKLSEDLKAKYGVGSYSAAGIAASREDYYFYWSILGINRAANWLWNRDDVDRTRFNYTGGSQGGGFGLYLCGLNPRFTSATLFVPAMSDTLGSLKGRVCGFPYVLEMNGSPDRAAAARRNAPYFNGAFFAARMKCPVRVAIGFIDEICPPTGIYAAYNAIGSADKGIVHGLRRGHGVWPEAAPVRDWQERNFFARPAKGGFEVYFMRHGETSWNRAKVLQGSIAYTDITAKGVGMAADSAAEFRRRGIAFDAVYTSPYRRASHTAEIVAASQGLTAKADARIRERCCGTCEGVRYETGERLAELLRAATGVESVEAVGDRAMEFLEKELAPLDGKVKRVLCVGHTLLLSVIEARLRGEREVRKDLLPNCCVHVLAYKDGRFTLKERAQVFYDPAKYEGRSKVRYVAHRGAGDLTMPEASKPAYADAVAKSSDIVKLDLQKTKDGVIVMGHDPSLKRVMGWDAKIKDLSYAEILEKGDYLWRKKPTGERIVRLDEALEIVRPVPEFWIDFKHFDPDFAERVLKTFADKGIDESRVMVATFSKGALEYFKRRHPSVRRVGHIAMKSSDELPRVVSDIDELGLFGVNMPVLDDQTSLEAIAELKRKGVWVSLWFVQNEKKSAKYGGSGCDAFVTDYVSRVR